MKDKLVSVIITTHNRSDKLEYAIRSVVNQTYKNIEIIVIDDASNGDDKAKAKKLIEKYSIDKYVYITKAESKGGNHARNVGIKKSNGELLAFLDDDDVWHLDKIEKQVQAFLTTGCQVIGCGRDRVFISNDKVIDRVTDIRKNVRNQDYSTIIFQGPPFVTSQIMITKSALEFVGFFDESLKAWQEYDLLIRLSSVYKFWTVEDSLVDYSVFINDKNRISNSVSKFYYSSNIINNKYKSRLNKLDNINKILWEKLILEELASRSTELKKKREYMFKIYKLQPNFKNYLYYLFNVDRSNNKIIKALINIRNLLSR